MDDPDKRKPILPAEIHTNAIVYIEYTPEAWVYQKAHQPQQHGSCLTMHSIGLIKAPRPLCDFTSSSKKRRLAANFPASFFLTPAVCALPGNWNLDGSPAMDLIFLYMFFLLFT
jgi:hypothetical protein